MTSSLVTYSLLSSSSSTGSAERCSIIGDPDCPKCGHLLDDTSRARRRGRRRRKVVVVFPDDDDDDSNLMIIRSDDDDDRPLEHSDLCLAYRSVRARYRQEMLQALRMQAGLQRCTCGVCVSCRCEASVTDGCLQQGCRRKPRRLGMCYLHYAQNRARCSQCNVTSAVVFKGDRYCKQHFLAMDESRCLLCDTKPAHILPEPLCTRHYSLLRRSSSGGFFS